MSESAYFWVGVIALNTLGYHFLGSIYDDRTTCLETKIRKRRNITTAWLVHFDRGMELRG